METAEEFVHSPVLLEEVIRYLDIKEDGIYIDGTVGGGGHAFHICEKLGENGRLIGIDQDEAAVEASKKRLAPFGSRAEIVRSNYCHMKDLLWQMEIEQVDGILLDLGVSSYQFDTASRGFSYQEDAPLDMRMDQRQEMTARDIVNSYSEGELTRIIRDFGEDRFAKNIAANICREREKKPVETTCELADIVKSAIPARYRNSGGHPAKRTFQAIRIELNQELQVLQDSLNDMIGLLAQDGRICVITFHSLEDRIVKTIFKKNENPCICPPEFPVCVCNRIPQGRVLTRKPVLPSEKEIEKNRRARSAKLRVFQKDVRETDPMAQKEKKISVRS